jgi:hypothetical protein
MVQLGFQILITVGLHSCYVFPLFTKHNFHIVQLQHTLEDIANSVHILN